MAKIRYIPCLAFGAVVLATAPVMAGEVSDYPTYGPVEEEVVNGVRIPRPKANEHQRHVGPSSELWAYLQSLEDPKIGTGTTGPSYIDDAPEGAPVPLPKPRKRILDGGSGV